MNAWMAVPMPLRLLVVGAVGASAGMLVNAWVERLKLSYLQRAVPAGNPIRRRRGVEWLPLLGAWVRAGHVPRSWRALLVEIGAALGFTLAYWWEIERLALVVPPLTPEAAASWRSAMHFALIAHLLLGTFMLAAALIDLDERIIPDEITIPGTLLGLVLVALAPGSLLPDAGWLPNNTATVETLLASSPSVWPQALGGLPHLASLILAIGCLGLWCFALLPRPWRARRGWRTAVALCVARIRRERFSRHVALLFGLGVGCLIAVWSVGGMRWQSLLSSLLGMVAGGGIVWIVRIIGAVTLRREAMGFGDVTLMAMIGTILGWQPVLMVFFIAPFFGLALFVAQAVAARDAEIPYGPSLCLGAVAVIARWPLLWGAAEDAFAVWWLVPATLLVLLAAMTVMLGAWGAVKRRWPAVR